MKAPDLKQLLWFFLPPTLIVVVIYYLQASHGISNTEALLLALIALPLAAVMDLPPKLRARFVAHRRGIGPLAASIPATIAGAMFLSSSRPLDFAEQLSPIYISFILQGILVGFTARRLLGRAFLQVLFGKTKEEQRLMVALPICMFFALMPLSSHHKPALATYLLGFALGLLLHQSYRSYELTTARYGREKSRLRLIAKNYGPIESNEEVVAAEELLARGKFTELDRLLKARRHQQGFSESDVGLVIVQASMLKHQGSFLQSVSVLEEYLQANVERLGPKEKQMIAVLLSLNQGELGNSQKMCTHLRDALSLDPECPAAKMTLALRLSEDPTLASEFPDLNPLRLIREAIEYVESRPGRPPVEKRVIARAVPIRSNLLLDAYGYVLLRSGFTDLSRTMIALCLYEDTSFSSPFLHLGEWMLESLKRGNEKARDAAELALYSALLLEQGRDSLIRRRAEALLLYLNTLGQAH